MFFFFSVFCVLVLCPFFLDADGSDPCQPTPHITPSPAPLPASSCFQSPEFHCEIYAECIHIGPAVCVRACACVCALIHKNKVKKKKIRLEIAVSFLRFTRQICSIFMKRLFPCFRRRVTHSLTERVRTSFFF